MSEVPTDYQAIETARAALVTFLASDLREAHLAADGVELFIARDGAGQSPMRSIPEMLKADEGMAILAPHVATLVSITAIGTEVKAGEPIAMLRVLDDERPLLSPAAGVIARLTATPGELLDYGAAILSLRVIAG